MAALSGIALGWLGRSRANRQDIAQQASEDAIQRKDVEYIKRGVDEIKNVVQSQAGRIDGLAERVTRLEESAKQAHKRIDRLEGDG